MDYVDLVALLAVAQLVFFSVLVGRARGRYGIKTPAVTGHEGIERAYRVQMNTLELMVAFLPALFIAGKYWPQAWVGVVGAVYLFTGAVMWPRRAAAGLDLCCRCFRFCPGLLAAWRACCAAVSEGAGCLWACASASVATAGAPLVFEVKLLDIRL